MNWFMFSCKILGILCSRPVIDKVIYNMIVSKVYIFVGTFSKTFIFFLYKKNLCCIVLKNYFFRFLNSLNRFDSISNNEFDFFKHSTLKSRKFI